MADVLTLTAPIRATRPSSWRVLTACTLGGLFEWYDFYVYAALAGMLSAKFFPPGNQAAAFMSTLAAFGAGFLVRPVGALVFGRLGDKVGRKVTFIVTMAMMGLATVGVGLLPTFGTAGIWATVLLVAMRLIQGLAHGGETGGAIVYLAEYAPAGRRGLLTSVLQTTACLGFVASLVVTLGVRTLLTTAQFEAFGWRIPFLLSVLLLSVSIYIRSQLGETPVFKKMESSGGVSRSPIRDSLGNIRNLGRMLLVLVPCAGLGAIFGTSEFHSMFFLNRSLGVPLETVQMMVCIALFAAVPFYPVFGWLSDRIGRRPVILCACLAAALTISPLFHALTHFANPRLEAFQKAADVTLEASDCRFHLFSAPTTECDKISAQLAEMGVPFKIAASSGAAVLHVGETTIAGPDRAGIRRVLTGLGWPDHVDARDMNIPAIIAIIFVLNLYLALIFAPLAAFMAEMFPSNIRYTSSSFPFQIGAGWVGGFLPFAVAAIDNYNGDIYSGLKYPVFITAAAFVFGLVFMRETKNNEI